MTIPDDGAAAPELTFWQLLERLAQAWGARLTKWRGRQRKRVT